LIALRNRLLARFGRRLALKAGLLAMALDAAETAPLRAVLGFVSRFAAAVAFEALLVLALVVVAFAFALTLGRLRVAEFAPAALVALAAREVAAGLRIVKCGEDMPVALAFSFGPGQFLFCVQKSVR